MADSWEKDVQLVYGFMLQRDLPAPIQDAIDRLIACEYADEVIEEPEPEPEAKPKKKHEWSDEQRAAASQRMKDRIASGAIKPGSRKPADDFVADVIPRSHEHGEGEPSGNGSAPDEPSF